MMDLGFLAPDPSPAQQARAFARVSAAGRRRRARRRVAAAGPVLVLAGIGAAALWPGGGGTTDVTSGSAGSGPEPSASPTDPAAVTWDEAILSADGLTLRIAIGTAPSGPGPCDQSYVYDVEETSGSVAVVFRSVPSDATAAPDDECIVGRARPQEFEVGLDQALGDREVTDGVRPDPRPVHRLGDLVVVTYRPRGFEPAAPTIDAAGQEGAWSQTFRDPSSDWYFVVEQQRTPPPATGTRTSIDVNGTAAERYTGQDMGGESIRFPLGEETITVRAVPRQDGDLARSEEVLAIARGIQAPS